MARVFRNRDSLGSSTPGFYCESTRNRPIIYLDDDAKSCAKTPLPIVSCKRLEDWEVKKYFNGEKRSSNYALGNNFKRRKTLDVDESSRSSAGRSLRSGIMDVSYIKTNDYGRLVWAKHAGSIIWPAIIFNHQECEMDPPPENATYVVWLGDHSHDPIRLTRMFDFAKNFTYFFQRQNSTEYYNSAVKEALQEACVRANVRDVDLNSFKELVRYADRNLNTEGSSKLILPTNEYKHSKKIKMTLSRLHKIQRREITSTLFRNEVDKEDKRCYEEKSALYEKVRNGLLDIETLCIACDRTDCTIAVTHPLFEGGLCINCKDEVHDGMHHQGSDGMLKYCSVCGCPGDIILCDMPQCPRGVCEDCVNLLIFEDATNQIQDIEPWYCFLCHPTGLNGSGLITPRANWVKELEDRNLPNLKIVPIPSRITDNIDVNLLNTPDPSTFPKRPLRVLSLFDGIGTGLFVLDKLGLQVEKYYACEIEDNAINVCDTQFGDRITHLGDVQLLKTEEILEMCPIDLVIGGSPCNDLACVNPNRRGLYDPTGTGILFFQYMRVLNKVIIGNMKTNTHLFWLFENVYNMNREFRRHITMHFEKEPVIINSKHFSAQNRTRCFWGNIPGMSRELPDNVGNNLSDCVRRECNRKALVDKINSVTTNVNSLVLRNGSLMPIQMGEQGDIPWITELEKVFGFPRHYTDVGNMGVRDRQVLLGRAWSVGVVKHLLQPLLTYFKGGNGSNEMSPLDGANGQTAVEVIRNNCSTDVTKSRVSPPQVPQKFRQDLLSPNAESIPQNNVNATNRTSSTVPEGVSELADLMSKASGSPEYKTLLTLLKSMTGCLESMSNSNDKNRTPSSTKTVVEEELPISVQKELPAPVVQDKLLDNGNKDELLANENKGELPADVGQDELPADVAHDELPGDVGQDELPGDVDQDELPGDVDQDELPANVAQEELPADVAQDELPADVDQDELPANVDQDELPADVDQDELLADVDQDELPADVDQDELRADVDQDELRADVDQDELRADVDQDELRADVDQEELPADVGQEELPADVDQDELPADVAQDELPADVAQDELPPDVAQDELPADVAQDELPADVAQDELPADVGQNELPADVGQNELPADVGQSELPTEVGQDEISAALVQKKLPATVVRKNPQDSPIEIVLEDFSSSKKGSEDITDDEIVVIGSVKSTHIVDTDKRKPLHKLKRVSFSANENVIVVETDVGSNGWTNKMKSSCHSTQNRRKILKHSPQNGHQNPSHAAQNNLKRRLSGQEDYFGRKTRKGVDEALKKFGINKTNVVEKRKRSCVQNISF